MTPTRERQVCFVVLLNALLMWAISERYVVIRDARREVALVTEANSQLESRRADRVSLPVESEQR